MRRWNSMVGLWSARPGLLLASIMAAARRGNQDNQRPRSAGAYALQAKSVGEAIDMLRTSKVNAFALGRDTLASYQVEIPGWVRAMAMPKNRPGALAHSAAFLKEPQVPVLGRRIFDRAGRPS